MIISGGVKVPARAVAEMIAAEPDAFAVEVIGVPDAEWGERVVAFVAPDDALEPGVDPRPRSTRASGRRASSVLVKEIPLLPNGKARPCPAAGDGMRVFSIPLTTRFRGITVREGVLLEGAAGWGEFSPFLEYDASTSAPWLDCAREAADVGWPAPCADR